MKIGIDSFLFNNKVHDGPKIFLKRLKDSIEKNKLATVTNTYHPFYDIGIFSVIDKNYFNKNYILRVDGIYIDLFDYVGNSEKLNNKIFHKISCSKGVVFISEFSKKIVEKFYKKKITNSTIIHNKVPISLFKNHGETARSKLNISDDQIVLITAAKWRRHKRLEETIKFLKILNEKKKRYKLIVLGEDINQKNLDDVYFVGKVDLDDLPFWYRAADVYLHLCWIEACGNTQIEALACGLPVLCCNNGGIGETVVRANGGIVSRSDKDYNFEKVDLYNPPEPDYKVLKSDLEKIFANYQYYKKNIDYKFLDIDIAAQEYISFIKNIK